MMKCVFSLKRNDASIFPTNYYRSSRSNNFRSSSFRDAIKWPIYLAQILCMIPFLCDSRSVKVCSISIILCGQGVMFALTILSVNREGLNLHKAGCILYFAGAITMMLLMTRLVSMWPKLMKSLNEIELCFGYQKNLKITFISLSTLVTLLSTDLVFVAVFIIVGDSTRAQNLKIYAQKIFPQVFGVIKYDIWWAILVVYVNAVSILLYSFSDQFIIMISLALGNYFSVFNRRILSVRRKPLPEGHWRMFRKQYTMLCKLNSIVDECFCHLLSLTFILHLYILCVTIREGFSTDGWEKIYAVLVFITSVLRASGLCYSTVRIHEESKSTLEVLYTIPPSSYCAEIELFIQQVLGTDVVLSGSHIFSMKRKFLLTIGGAIISSQILLSQIKDFKPSRLQ